MYTLDDIRVSIVPVPQKVTAAEGNSLKLLATTKFRFTAPAAESGPVKTAAERMSAFLKSKCGEDCF